MPLAMTRVVYNIRLYYIKIHTFIYLERKTRSTSFEEEKNCVFWLQPKVSENYKRHRTIFQLPSIRVILFS